MDCTDCDRTQDCKVCPDNVDNQWAVAWRERRVKELHKLGYSTEHIVCDFGWNTFNEGISDVLASWMEVELIADRLYEHFCETHVALAKDWEQWHYFIQPAENRAKVAEVNKRDYGGQSLLVYYEHIEDIDESCTPIDTRYYDGEA